MRLLPFFVFLVSCEGDLSRYGKVERSAAKSGDYFIFSVSEEYNKSYPNSEPDVQNPKITKAENKLLTKLLQKKGYCISEDGDAKFKITSKQEKVFDMTFAHLIEQHYNARPITPVIYYGRCFDEKAIKKQIRRDFEVIKKEVVE
ncbi:MAG: hypothetical protein FJ368_02800 [Pelagibacterales bacterium]|nr:hypothetical protein [Pelagibacterales bacterium]